MKEKKKTLQPFQRVGMWEALSYLRKPASFSRLIGAWWPFTSLYRTLWRQCCGMMNMNRFKLSDRSKNTHGMLEPSLSLGQDITACWSGQDATCSSFTRTTVSVLVNTKGRSIVTLRWHSMIGRTRNAATGASCLCQSEMSCYTVGGFEIKSTPGLDLDFFCHHRHEV